MLGLQVVLAGSAYVVTSMHWYSSSTRMAFPLRPPMASSSIRSGVRSIPFRDTAIFSDLQLFVSSITEQRR